jgi:hypothetical protein
MRVAGLSYSFMANLLDDCMTERWYTDTASVAQTYT